MREQKEILIELHEIAKEDYFFKSLLILVYQNLVAKKINYSKNQSLSKLNENEIIFLFGLWLKYRNYEAKLSYNSSQIIAELTHELLDEYHETFLKYFPKPESTKIYSAEFLNSPECIKETISYAGSGGYDYQYINFFEDKYNLDEKWLSKNKGFKLQDVKNLYTYIKGTINYKLNLPSVDNTSIELYSFNFNNYIFKKNPSFFKILDCFTFYKDKILNSNFNDIGDLNDFRIFPVLKLKDKYVIPFPFLLAIAIYESPFYWMRSDKLYSNVALQNRGDVAEKIVKKILKRKIKNKDIYSSIEVRKLKAETLTDIDVCIINDNKMVIFQVKSKRLTQPSKEGNVEKFQDDFKKAVKDAHLQALKPINSILSKTCKFYRKGTKKNIELPNIDKILTVCIVLDSYPAITAHTRLFYHNEEYNPITMSIFDLEIIMEYLPDYETLFDYLEKRTNLSKYFLADNELSLFSNYLKNDLKKLPNSDIAFLNPDFAARFDSEYYYPLMFKSERQFDSYYKNIGRNDFCFCGSGKKYKKCCVKLPVANIG